MAIADYSIELHPEDLRKVFSGPLNHLGHIFRAGVYAGQVYLVEIRETANRVTEDIFAFVKNNRSPWGE